MSDFIPTVEQIKLITGNLGDRKPRVVFGMPDKEYRETGGCNMSFLKTMWPRPGSAASFFEKGDKPAYRFGRYVHQAILTPNDPVPAFVLQPDVYYPDYLQPDLEKKWNGNATVCKAWKAAQEAAGREVFTRDEYENMVGTVRSLAENAVIKSMMAKGDAEVSCFAPMEVNGIEFVGKTRIDWVPKGGSALCNIKTVLRGGTDKHEFLKSVKWQGYGIQAAYELHIWNLCNPDDQRHDYVWPVVEKAAPYIIRFFDADRYSLAPYVEQMQERLATFAKCIENGVFPGDDNDFTHI